MRVIGGLLIVGVLLWLFSVTLPFIWWIWLLIIGYLLLTYKKDAVTQSSKDDGTMKHQKEGTLTQDKKTGSPIVHVEDKKLLHLDDDVFLRDMYKNKFEEAGFEVVSLEKLEQDLVSHVARINPDIVVSDLVKPAPDGVAILKALKGDERTRTIPFVFLSNTINPDEAHGAQDVIIKADASPTDAVNRIARLVTSKFFESK